MAERTHIQWAALEDEEGELLQGGTLNLAGGCNKVSPACTNCYAMAVTRNLWEKFGKENLDNKYAGLTHLVGGRPEWTGKIVLFPERIEPFVRKRKPKGIFVSSLTDMMHKDIPDEYLDMCFGAFAVSNSRIYFLTKRPERGIEYLNSRKEQIIAEARKWEERVPGCRNTYHGEWPLKNVWFGTSIGTTKCLETLGRDVLDVNARVLWYSMEPLLENISFKEVFSNLTGTYKHRLKWAVVGGESGPRSRGMELDWGENILSDLKECGISPFMKQKGEVLARKLGCTDRKGGDFSEFPTSIRIREFPKPELVGV